MTEFHKDAPVELRDIRERWHDERFNQLNALRTSSAGAAWSYLLTCNGGAAAGILAFIGAKDEIAVQPWPYIALCLFVAGLLCVGVAHAVTLHKAQGLLNSWSSTMVDYWSNKVRWSELMRLDQKRSEHRAKVPWLLGWLALVLFVAGLSVTAWNFRHMALAT